MLKVSELFIYPIKSLGGITLNSVEVTDRGFTYDRRWMLVDDNNEFLTQRTHPQLALLQVFLQEDGLLVKHKKTGSNIHVPFEASEEGLRVSVWSDVCKAVEVDKQVSAWFSEVLSIPCKLVFMPITSLRRVDTRYATGKEITAFTDGYPFTIIGQSSLDDLNSRIEEQLTINRFRPNIVFTGGAPFEEDEWAEFKVGSISFYGVKLCARCVVTTIDQEQALKGNEPLQTLSKYRRFMNKIYFGQNLLHKGQGQLTVGQAIEVINRKKSRV